jgi:radical SAM protein with 4Fe4S-binding SPASM domain
MIPVLDTNRAYIYSNSVSLYLKSGKSIIVSNDGWEILKHCDGTKTIDEIFDILSIENEISKNDVIKFINTAKNNSVVRFIDSFEKNDTKFFGNRNLISPQIASIELTNTCNLECNYCYGEYKRGKGEFWDIEDIKMLFDSLSASGIMVIELTGGEPLMHPKSKEIIELAVDKFELISILTNGVLFNDKIAKIVQKHKNKITFQISIDGCSEETNHKVRRVKNTFEKTLNAIKQLENIGVYYNVVYMITEENKHEIPNICKLFRHEKLRNLLLSKAVQFGRGCDNKTCLIKKGDTQITETIEKMLKEYPDVFSKKHYQQQQYHTSMDEMSKFNINNCGIGWKLISIASNGDVRSCSVLGKIGNMGNIFKQDISDILNSGKGNFYLNFSKIKNEESCNICRYKNYCATCITRIYAANIQRVKDGIGLCDIVKRNNMEEYFDFYSNFKFII